MRRFWVSGSQWEEKDANTGVCSGLLASPTIRPSDACADCNTRLIRSYRKLGSSNEVDGQIDKLLARRGVVEEVKAHVSDELPKRQFQVPKRVEPDVVGYSGLRWVQELSFHHSPPRLGCLGGTFSPSRGQI